MSVPLSDHLNKNKSEVQQRAKLKAYQDRDNARIQARQNNPSATYNHNAMEKTLKTQREDPSRIFVDISLIINVIWNVEPTLDPRAKP